MITIFKNKKEIKIPTANELTVNQYIDFMARDRQDIINYLSVVLNVDYNSVWNFRLNEIESDTLFARIGQVEDYTKLKPKKYILGNEIKEVETFGQRYIIEETSYDMKPEELFCFVLAVCIVCEPNENKINEYKDKLMDMPYIDVLPTGFFLLKNLRNGKISGNLNLKNLIHLIKTKVSKNRQVSKI